MKPFELHVDTRKHRLDIVLRGFWDDIIFDAFLPQFAFSLEMFRPGGGCLVALVDGTEFAVQSRTMLFRMKEAVRDLGPLCARRTGIIVPAELNRMQAHLAGEAIRHRVFATRAEAEAWLADDESAQWSIPTSKAARG